MPTSQRGAGEGLSWGLCSSSHLSLPAAVGPAAVSLCSGPWHLACTSGRCPWLQHLSAHRIRRPPRGPAIGRGTPRHPHWLPRVRPPRSAPAGGCQCPGSREAHPLSLLGQSRSWSGAGRGLGQQPRGSKEVSVPAGPPRERLVPVPSYHFLEIPLSPGSSPLLALSSGPLVRVPSRDMEEFLQRAKSKLVN